MDEHENDEMGSEELAKLVEIDRLVESGDVIAVPPQIHYGLSIFAMTEGDTVLHVTRGQGMDEDAQVPLANLLALLREATDNVLFMKFEQQLVANSLARRAAKKKGE